MAHTPGPWQLEMPDFDVTYDDYQEHGDGFTLLESSCAKLSGPNGKWKDFARVVVAVHGEKDEEGEANARLIAAAPDLLESCKNLLSAFDGTKLSDSLIKTETDAIRAAIAKAEAE